jgi:DNA polymerase III subunit delta
MTYQELLARLDREEIAPVYLVIGDDERGKDEAVARFAALVDEDLRAFNVERFHAEGKAVDDVVGAARTLPMMGGRRVVLCLHVERLFKTRGKGGGGEVEEEGGAGDLAALEAYVGSPEPSNVLVLVASEINRTMRLGKLLMKHAAIVECRGFAEAGGRPDGGLRQAMEFVVQRLRTDDKRIDGKALAALVECTGPDIVRLRGAVERILLYVGDAAAVSVEDVRAVVGAPVSLDDWGVTNAIQARDAAAALRMLDLALASNGVPFMILGQLGWWVRTRMAQSAPARVGDAVRAVFRADGAMKSGGQPRVVLERLIVELCGPAPAGAGPAGGARQRPTFTPRSGR